MRWPWRRRRRPLDGQEYERDAKTRQGDPEAMRCRLCNGARVTRLLRDPIRGETYRIRYCPKCDHINRRK